MTNSLFPDEPLMPEGFSYLPDFISLREEQQLCELIFTLPLTAFLFHGFEAKRKVISYGYDYHPDSRSITEGEPVPTGFSFLLERAAAHLRLQSDAFEEVLVTEYPVGSAINWHRDAPPFELIAGISLAADCVFRLRPYDKSKRGRAATLSVPVRRRSLYVLRGPARSQWEHSTRPVTEVRYSITLRTLRRNPAS